MAFFLLLSVFSIVFVDAYGYDFSFEYEFNDQTLSESIAWEKILEEDGSDEFYEGKIEIENGTGEWNFPVQKNAELEEVITTISTDQTVASPSLAVDDQTQWEYPEEYGVLNALDEFVEGESVELEISGGEDETVEVKLPVSIVESGQFYIKRNEIDPEYHIEMDVGEETVWTRTEDDDLLGPAEEWVSGEDLRSADHIETETGKYIAAGGLPGRVYIHDAITGDELDEYNPGTGRLKRVLFQSSEGDDPIGLSMGRTGEIHRFAYDFDMEELTGEYLNSTHMYNDILFTYDLTENGWEDVITIRDEEILVSYNEGEEDITPFEKIHSLPHRPNDVSITPEGRFMTACSDRAMVEIFDYVSGSLEYMFNITLEETARKAFGLEYTGDGVMDLVIQNRAGDIEVFTEDEDGNYTTAQHIEVDFSVTDMAIADLNENGLDDLVFTSVHRDSRRSYVYLNHGGEFVEEYDFLMSGGGLEINPKDVEGDGDIDLLMVSNNYIYVARNRLNWKRERVSDLASSLQSYLDQSTPEYDQWNNPMVNVPITIRSEYDATFTLSDLNIQYDYSPTVDITEAVENHMDTAEANQTGWVNVPATITADDDVTFTAQTTVTYSARPPILSKHIPTYTARRAHEEHLIDLDDYFYDPLDQRLTYSITHQQDQDNLTAYVDEHYLSFHSEGKVGSYEFRVQATNEDGYSIESNTFVVQVTPRLDIPDYKLRAETRSWYDIAPYASELEGEERELTTDSEHVTAHAHNMTLELYYEQQTEETVEVSLTVKNSTATDRFNVTVTPYNVPIIGPIPDVTIERGENLSEENSINVFEHTSHPEEPVEELQYTLNWEDDRYITLQMAEDGWLHGTIDPDYHGTSNIEVTVEDVQNHSDTTEFALHVNNTMFPPIYLGNIQEHHGTTVTEGERWTINLENYFEQPDNEELLYTSNKDEIRILNRSWATWEPEGNASNLYDVTFTARLSAYPQLRAESDPINLFYEEKPPMPIYIGGLYSTVVNIGETWSVDLSDHFDYPNESMDNLSYSTNRDEISIEDGIASWTPEDNRSLTNVTFTAYDRDNPALNATSQPIDLVVPDEEGTPTPYILSITPDEAEKGETIHFEGRSTNALGNVTYRWTSDIDGVLYEGENRGFNTTLSPGEHTIELQVRDLRGEWSDPITRSVTVEEEEDALRGFLYSNEFRVAVAIIIVGAALNFIGMNVLDKPRKE